MSGMAPHEIVRLHRQKVEHGFNILQEFSFTDDHAIHQRLTIMQDDGKFECLAGWQRLKNVHGKWINWDDIKKVMSYVFKKELEGYHAVWATGYGPEPTAFDYMKTVTW